MDHAWLRTLVIDSHFYFLNDWAIIKMSVEMIMYEMRADIMVTCWDECSSDVHYITDTIGYERKWDYD